MTAHRKVALAACVIVAEIALILLELAFPVVFPGNAALYAHVGVIFLPLAVGALLLDTRWSVGLGAATGAILFIHASFIPMDYYEAYFATPVAIVPITLISLVLALCMRSACGLPLLDKLDKDAPLRPFAPRTWRLALASIITSIACSLTLYVFTGATADGLASGSQVIGHIAHQMRPYLFVQVATMSTLFLVAASLCAAVEDRRRRNQLNGSMRAVFSRWLVAVLFGSLAVVMSVFYLTETIVSRAEASSEIDAQIDYFSNQIADFSARHAELEANEAELVTDKATATAAMLAVDPAAATSPEKLTAICEKLNLKSLNVVNGSGLLVGTADGGGMGSYNFYEHPENSRYLPLLEGKIESVVEEPRASKNAETGELSGDVEVFAGVPRMDAPGFIMVSINATDYADALNAASISNLATGYKLGEDGKVYVISDGTIVTTNDPAATGVSIEEMLDDQRAVVASLDGAMLDLYDAETMQETYGKVAEYRLEGTDNTYQIAVFLPASEVFAARTDIARGNLLLYTVLFIAVFILTSLLLDNVAVRRFKETNDVLSLITDGDLDQTVNVTAPSEFAALSSGINSTVDALKQSIAAEAARLDRELLTARAIQESALPRTFPAFPDIESFDLYATMEPAREVGGDFYDFFLVDEHKLAFLIADVSGKGIPASLFMMSAKTEISRHLQAGLPIEEAIAHANVRLCAGNDSGIFVTVWAGILDWESGTLVYVNAGHNPPLMRQNGTWEWMRQRSGLFLGTFETAKYRRFETTLVPGDKLLLYTDGVTEAWDPDEQQYGEEQLETFLESHGDLHPRELIESVKVDLARWANGAEQSDDITMLSLEFVGSPQASNASEGE